MLCIIRYFWRERIGLECAYPFKPLTVNFMSIKLHYVFEPLCGWCYAASPLLAELQNRFGASWQLVFHPGLLFATPRTIDQAYRKHIINADMRIAELAGVEFGAPYLSRVRSAAQLQFHSKLPAAAVLAVRALNPALGLPMLELIQQSHYQLGEDVNDTALLTQLAETLGLAPADFAQALEKAQSNLPSLATDAQNLMQAVASNGFPTLVLEQGGEYQKLDHSSCYGKPSVLADCVEQLVTCTSY